MADIFSYSQDKEIFSYSEMETGELGELSFIGENGRTWMAG